MSLATSGIVASIVPSGLTGGIAVAATVMLALAVAVMVFLAVAPIVSDAWADRLSATETTGTKSARSAEPSDD